MRLCPGLRNVSSPRVFKTNIIKLIRPTKKSIFNLHDVIGIKKKLYQLRVGLSPQVLVRVLSSVGPSPLKCWSESSQVLVRVLSSVGLSPLKCWSESSQVLVRVLSSVGPSPLKCWSESS